MAKAFSLQPLVYLAQQKNDAATKKLGRLNQTQQSAQEKLDMLQQYRRDYQGKLQEAEQGGLSLEELRNFQDFILRLEEAIKQQQAVFEQSVQVVQQGRIELMEAQRRMKSFETLAQRHVEAERKLEAKADQKIQDEHSSRRAAYKNIELNDEL